MKYIWQHSKWPHFQYSLQGLEKPLYLFAKIAGELGGGLAQVSADMQQETWIELLISEAMKTSEIEGEYYNQEDLRSSLKNQLGLSKQPEKVKDPRASNITKLMVEVRQTYEEPLTKELLFAWHNILMADAHYKDRLNVGHWRTSVHPMQIVSGPIGREKVHYEAPPSSSISKEMDQFIAWFNETNPVTGRQPILGPVRAAITHLYFEVIHPFEDGNGRIGRALVEKALSQDLQRPLLLSLSSQIVKNKKEYYDALSYASRCNVEITPWIRYFIHLLCRAQISTQAKISFTLAKAKFWNQYEKQLNERQIKAIQRMFAEGVDGFKGGMSARKYMIITACSKATATRDLTELYHLGCIKKLNQGGRSTSYEITIHPPSIR